MGNKVSTAKRLPKVSTDTLKRSNINQLPSKDLKEKYANPQPRPEPQQESSVPEGRDGHDPQEHHSGFIGAINQITKALEEDKKNEAVPTYKASESITQLQNRKQNEAKKEFTVGQLNSLLLEMHDPRYKQDQVLKDYSLGEEWREPLQKIRVANTYRQFKENKKDEITHEAVFEEKNLEFEGAGSDRDVSELKRRLE